MKITIKYHLDAIAIMRIEGALKHASALMELRQHCLALVDKGIRALLIDLSDSPRANMAGLAALVEFAGTSADFHVAYCNMNEGVQRRLAATGLDRGLHVHKTASDALKSDYFKRASLRLTTAVILCNKQAKTDNSVFKSISIPMLDVLGQPLIQRIKNQLSDYGMQDIIANPGHLGDQIVDHFRKPDLVANTLRFANEGARFNGEWVSERLGSAGSLQRIQQRQSAFQSDFLVLAGNTLTGLDFDALMAFHQEQHADVTIAQNPTESYGAFKRHWRRAAASRTSENPIEIDTTKSARSSLSDGYAYVFSPRVLEMAAIQSNWNIKTDFLPALAAADAKICGYIKSSPSIEITSPYDYARELNSLLSSPFKQDALLGVGKSSPLISEHATVSNKAWVSAQSFVGSGAKIGSGVEILGTCVIGAGAEIAGPSVLENCVVFGGARIEPGFWAHGMTIHRDWSFNHDIEKGVGLTIPSELPTVPDTIAFPMQKSA